MTWKAVTKQVSKIDANGSVGVVFDIFDDNDVLRIAGQGFTGDADTIKATVTDHIKNLKRADRKVEQDPMFQVGQSFEV